MIKQFQDLLVLQMTRQFSVKTYLSCGSSFDDITLKINEYDIVIWCDGYWHPQNNPGIFKILINRCLNSKGGLIISDNVMWSGKVLNKASTKDKSTVALQAYNIKLKLDSRIKSVLLPFRDGLTLSWVL